MIVSQKKLLADEAEGDSGVYSQASEEKKKRSLAWLALLKGTWDEWTSDNGAQYGAALAFYSMLALSPMLLFLVTIVSFFYGDEAARGEVVGAIGSYVGPENAETLQGIIKHSNEKQGAGWLGTIIGLVTMLVGASGVFNQLQLALNVIWDVKPKEDAGIFAIVQKRFLSLAMVFGTGFLLLVSLGISAGIAVAQKYVSDQIPLSGWLWSGINFLVTLGIVFVLFGAIYKFLPDADIRWKHVALGAAVSSVLFMIAKHVLTWYLGFSAPGSAYGAAGSLVAMVIWIYFSAQILLLGAEFAQVYSRRKEGRVAGPSAEGESCGKKSTALDDDCD